jgi:hypothetical protein
MNRVKIRSPVSRCGFSFREKAMDDNVALRGVIVTEADFEFKRLKKDEKKIIT